MVPLDVYGMGTSQAKAEVMRRLNIVNTSPFPDFAMDKW